VGSRKERERDEGRRWDGMGKKEVGKQPVHANDSLPVSGLGFRAFRLLFLIQFHAVAELEKCG